MSKADKNTFLPDGCLTDQTMLLYLEDKLTGEERNIAERHMQGCELCSDALEGISTVPVATRAALLTGITEEISAKINKGLSLFQTLSIAASVSVIAISGVFIYQYLKDGTQKETAVMKQETKEITVTAPVEIPEEKKIEVEKKPEPISLQRSSGPEFKQVEKEIYKTPSDIAIEESDKKEKTETLKPVQKEEVLSNTSINENINITDNSSGYGADQNYNTTNNYPYNTAQKNGQIQNKELVQKKKLTDKVQTRNNYYNTTSNNKNNTNSYSKKDISKSDNIGKPNTEEIIKAYDEKNYVHALQLINGYKSQIGEPEEVSFYDGMVNYELKKYDEAIAALNKISVLYKDYDQARFTLGKAYYEKGDAANAEVIFKEISQSKSKYRKEAASYLEVRTK